MQGDAPDRQTALVAPARFPSGNDAAACRGEYRKEIAGDKGLSNAQAIDVVHG